VDDLSPKDPSQAFVTALVTEHFVLQPARSSTVSEAVGRSAVYLTSVSSALIAFGFFAQTTHRLAPVVVTVLPALIGTEMRWRPELTRVIRCNRSCCCPSAPTMPRPIASTRRS
jgi:hypothetical protein